MGNWRRQAARNERAYQPSVIRSTVLQTVQWLAVQLGRLLALFGWRPYSSFDPASMKQEAIKMAGGTLTDFQDDDLQPALNHVLTSLRQDKDLSLFGRWFLHHHWVENVMFQRLQLAAFWKANPQYEDVPIKTPLFVIGYPRTGTTLFHYLLAMDPNAYAPPLWQATIPTPPPSHNVEEYDPRIEKVAEEMNLYFDISPLIRAMHPVDIHLPHECYHFFDRTYLDSQWSVRCQGESSYWEWYEQLSDEEAVAYYRDYRRQLKLLALHHPLFKGPNPTHYILKDVQVHSYHLGALLEVFPDANVIEMHRHPADSLKSYLLLESTVSELMYSPYNRKEYGARMFDTYKKRRVKIDAARKKMLGMENPRFLDNRYKEFIKDPIATVKSAYEHFGYKFTPEFEERMNDFLEENRQYKHGDYRHLLGWEPYGLSRSMVDETFSEYVQRFDL